MTFKLPKVYPLTDKNASGLSHAEQVARLIEGGATLIQLRDKQSHPKDFFREAEAALVIARKHDVKLIINDRLDIALALGADGVHLGQTDLPAIAVRRLAKDGFIIGVSTHNHAQAKEAATLPVDYIAFGPIFDTSTKSDHDPVAGIHALPAVREVTKGRPLVAIGGITPANAPEVYDAGADSVAVISCLFADPAKIAEILQRMLAEAPK